MTNTDRLTAIFSHYNEAASYCINDIAAENAMLTDAAKFEARVAVKLATNKFYLPCMGSNGGCYRLLCHIGCYDCRLMWARCEVEEEMEDEQTARCL